MEEWRTRNFPVGIKEVSVHGELTDYPLIVYYPAVKEGVDAIPDKEHAPYPALVFRIDLSLPAPTRCKDLSFMINP